MPLRKNAKPGILGNSPASQEPYALPFHPLELGEDALRALFGFVVEGYPSPDDIDADTVHMHEFRVSDPTGREQAEREAEMARAIEMMGPPRRFTFEGGVLREVADNDQ